MEIAVIVVLVLVAFAAVALPVVRGGRTAASAALAPQDIEREVLRYREAVRAETVCSRCGQANPAASRFCYDCGRSLPTRDREEFDGSETA